VTPVPAVITIVAIWAIVGVTAMVVRAIVAVIRAVIAVAVGIIPIPIIRITPSDIDVDTRTPPAAPA
jgi:hypothetical protein